MLLFLLSLLYLVSSDQVPSSRIVLLGRGCLRACLNKRRILLLFLRNRVRYLLHYDLLHLFAATVIGVGSFGLSLLWSLRLLHQVLNVEEVLFLPVLKLRISHVVHHLLDPLDLSTVSLLLLPMIMNGNSVLNLGSLLLGFLLLRL